MRTMITSILIAEDDPMMSHLYQKVFNFEGYQVEMAANGQEALDKARVSKPTLVILDIMMPVLNGLDALDQFKADANLKAIPVVMLTNLAGQQDAERALAKGAAKYIIKSEQDPKGVVAVVKEVLASAGAPVAPTPQPPTQLPSSGPSVTPPAL